MSRLPNGSAMRTSRLSHGVVSMPGGGTVFRDGGPAVNVERP